MPNINEGAKAWETELSRRIGAAVQTRRKQLKMTAQQLAERTKELGYPITRVAVSKIETNTRAGKFDIAELLVLAKALKVPPVSLLFSAAPDDSVEMLPGQTAPTFHAIAWFSGDRDVAWPGPEIDAEEAKDQANTAVADWDSPAATALRRMRERAGLHRDLILSRLMSKRNIKLGTLDEEAFNRTVEYDARLIGKIYEITDAITDAGTDNQGESE